MAPPRRRRSAEQAQRAILEAAEKRLREGGPEAVRLQEVARDLGVSHPAILHHFGSREGLMRALAGHVVARLETELLAGLRAAASQTTVLELIERVFESLGDAGQARLLAWRALSGDEPPPGSGGGPDAARRPRGTRARAAQRAGARARSRGAAARGLGVRGVARRGRHARRRRGRARLRPQLRPRQRGRSDAPALPRLAGEAARLPRGRHSSPSRSSRISSRRRRASSRPSSRSSAVNWESK